MHRGTPPASLVDLLRWRALRQPDFPTYTFLAEGEKEEGARLTNAGLDRQARAIGALLRRTGAQGERVLLLYPPGLEFVAAFFGCLYAGAVAVPAYPPRARTQSRLLAIARDARPRAVLTVGAIASKAALLGAKVPELREVEWLTTDSLPAGLEEEWQAPVLDAGSLAFLQYTSGSTADPKGVMVSHGNLLENQERIRQAFNQSSESVVVGWLPLYHDMGLIGNVLQPLYVGGRCVLMSPLAFLQRPLRWLEAISRHRATTSGGPNFAYDLCVRKISDEERAGLDLSSWTVAFNGAEPVRATTLEAFAAAFEPCGFDRRALYPCYGLAEATLFVTGGAQGREPVFGSVQAQALEQGSAEKGGGPSRTLVGCGHAWEDHQVVVVDPETGLPCPEDRVGEIWVAGPSVAHGYWNRPEETKRTFCCVLAGSSGPFLRTGDLGFLRGTELFVTGRIKDLIILRGRNLYPQDVELTAEKSHPALRPGCSAAFAVDADGEERLVLVCEVERGAEPEADAILAVAGAAVSEEHEVQFHDLVLLPRGAVPKTSSGKIQRRACRALYLAGDLPAVGRRVTPEILETGTDGERPPLEIWLGGQLAQALRQPRARFDRDRPLTALGLDSLAAVELQHAVSSELGVEVGVADLLEGPTLRELALDLSARRGQEARPAAAIPGDGSALPLSHGQRALWFLQRLQPLSAAYNIAAAAIVRPALDPALLRRAFEHLAKRHESLRAAFEETPAGPVQTVRPGEAIEFEAVDATAWDERRLADGIEKVAYRPFDLRSEPLLRVHVFRRSLAECCVLLVVHHIVADLWSLGILVRELGDLFAGRMPAGQPLRQADWAARQQERLSGPEGVALWAHWRERLAGDPPPLDLPLDRPRPPFQTFRGGARTLWLDRGLLAGTRALAEAHRTTLFAALLAAFEALLHRYSGQADMVVGAPTTGRDRPDVAGTVGYFVNPLPLRTDLSGDPSFGELLDRVREVALDAFRHQDLPFPLLVERLQPERDPSRSPLFQAMFALQKWQLATGDDLGAFALGGEGARIDLGGLTLESYALRQRVAQFDLELLAAESGGRLGMTLIFNADLFDAATAKRMLAHLEALLRQALGRPGERISGLGLLGEAERHQLAREWNDSGRRPSDGRTFLDLFAERVASAPHRTAATCGADEATWAELDARSSRLAGRLLRSGLPPEAPVALWAERGLDFLAAMLGVLKAGGAYLPLDPRQPATRLVQMLRQSRCRFVLASEPLLAACESSLGGEIPFLASLPDLLREDGTAPPALPRLRPERVAYVLFTSGSTGLPKGALIEHRGMLNHLWAKVDDLGLGPDDCVAQNAAATFDISVWQLLAGLLAGGRVRIVPDEVAGDPRALLAEVARNGVTVLETVPSLLREILAEAEAEPKRRADLSSLRWMIPTGEALPPELCARWFAAFPGIPLINAYGPTECSDDVTHHELRGPLPAGAARTPIGRPVSNLSLYVVDRGLALQPLGVPGELCVGGVGVGRGYLGDPARTAAVFVPDPHGRTPGARLYRTGDLGRLRPDGCLEFLGRLDAQVKIRGFRIEPGEVEAALAEHPALDQVVVLARAARGGDKRLVAYWAPRPGALATPAELREHLRPRLPEAMIPAAFVALTAMPLTPNGKIDRRALPEPPEPEAEVSAAPRDGLEALLAGIFAEVLGLERIGITESFFAAGGHSLLATRVASRVRRVLGVDLPLRILFEEPSVAGLAARLRELDAESRPAPALRPRERGVALPLSFGQQRLWFLDRMEPGEPVYNMPGAVRLRGTLDAAALLAALGTIVARHEALRTGFREEQGEPFQEIWESVAVSLPVVDLRALPAAEREPCAQRLAFDESRRPFDLSRPPLLRARLLRLKDEHHLLLFTLHHIVSDGWSQALLVRELSALYGGRGSLPELPVQYADYALWQREQLDGDRLEAQLSFWRQLLDGDAPALDLPLDRPRPPRRTYRGARRPVGVPAAATLALRRLCREQGGTLFMGLLTLFQALLHRHGGQERVRVGTPIANRGRLEIENLIGFFVNTLVLPSDLAGAPSLAGLLGRTRDAALGAFAHQDLPFERLVEELQPERDLSRSPLFQAMLILQNAPVQSLELPGLELSVSELDNGTAKFEITLSLEETEGGLDGWIEYNTDLFDAATVDRLARHFLRLLESGAEDPGRTVPELALISAAERGQLLDEWTDTRVEMPAVCAHQLFEAQVARTPDAEALLFEDESLTYAELGARADRLARRLRQAGVGAETPVGLCTERCADMVVGLLGILKAGGAYVPLDPSYPGERLAYMVEQAGVSILVTQAHLSPILPQGTGRILLDGLDGDRAGTVHAAVSPENLAYILFTSGSTGRPKGVAIPHRGLVNFLLSMAARPGLGHGVALLSVTTLSFDIAGLEIFLPLITGGRLVLASREVAADGVRLAAALDRARAGVMQATPATWRLLLDAGWEGSPGLTALCGGEALPRDLARALLPRVGRLWNLYGPTETTIWSTVADVGEESGALSIGRPIANTVVRVLDGRREPVPVGIAGELSIGGAGSARGYVGRPDLTAERFVPDPAGLEPGARLYRTGDLARWLPDGRLEFLGRIDQQVKVRGFRIELEEVEAALALHPAVSRAVAAIRGEGADRALAAYVVPSAPVAPGELRAFAARRLPEYMVPSLFTFLDALPLTPNGKVDRRALPDPGTAGAAEPAETDGAGSPEEQVLAGIWARVLGREHVGPHDSFFEMGGHSLLAARALSRIREAFRVDLPLRSLFEAPTVAAMARVLTEARHERRPAPPLQPVPRSGPLAASFAQERLWVMDQLLQDDPVFNVFQALRLDGPLDEEVLERSFGEVLRRHEILRTTFAVAHGRPVQVVAPPGGFRLRRINLSAEADPEGEARRLAREEARRPFDLKTGPLFRAALLAVGPSSRVLLLAMHHIVCDDWSIGLLVRETAALYLALRSGQESPLPELPLQYADFAAWQREWLSEEVLEEELGYWRRRLAGMPVLELPTDRPRPPVQLHRGAALPFELPETLCAALRRLGLGEDATLFMTLLAGFAAALARVSGQEDLIVGSPVAGRNRVETEPLIGFFVNILPLRIDLSGGPTWRELLRRVRTTALEAYDHQDVPFERLVEALQPRRDLSRAAVRQVVFALQDASMQPIGLDDVSVQPIDTDPGVARLDLTMFLWASGGGLRGVCEYYTDLFDEATVAGWLDLWRRALEDMAAGLERPVPPLAEPRPETRLRPEPNLTEGQLLFWFAPGLQPEVQLYFDRATTTFRMDGALDPALFERAFQRLVETCDVLRTRVREVDGLPWRTVAAPGPAPFEHFDFSGTPEPEEAFQTWLAERCRKEMDPQGRLFDVALAQLGPESFVWFFNAHHMIVDAGTLRIFARQLSLLYELARQDRLGEAPELPSYEEYVAAERENRRSERYARARVYWERKLAQPFVASAFHHRPGAPGTTRTARLQAELPAAISDAVRRLAAHRGFFSPSVLFSSVLFAYVHRLGGERRLRVGTSFANRTERFRNVAGLMMNTCPLQIEIGPGETLGSLTARVQEEMVETARHQHYPVRNPVDSPAYDVYINFQSAVFQEFCGLPVRFDLSHSGHSNDQLGLQVSDFTGCGRFRIDFDFNEAAFGREERERAVQHVLRLLEAFLEDEGTLISEVPFLSVAERLQLVEGWNGTAATLTGVPFADRFEEQAALHPEAVAASCLGERLTYRQLDDRAERLARALVRAGAGPEVVVPLLADRGLDFLAAVLAVFKAGAIYLPLDPHHPAERLARVLERSGVPLILHSEASRGHLAEVLEILPPAQRPRALALKALLDGPDGGPAPTRRAGGLAYVIFTSGSTGLPKGAMVEERGMINHLLAKVETLGLTARDVVAQNATQSFDISVWQLLVPLLVGGRVHILPDEIAHDPSRLLLEVVQEGITILEVVPSLLAVLLDHPIFRSEVPPALPDLRWILLTGEVLPPELCRRWLDVYPDIPVVNAYGPTECSDDVTQHVLSRFHTKDGPVPIGRPLRNLQLYVLDRGLSLLPAGIPGELCVGGVGVGRGYLGEPARTAEVFVPDALSGAAGARLYRTGDLARFLPDGSLEFLGRLDHQVKIRGFRIELGEIESLLARFPGVREAVVVAREDRPGARRLVGYFVPEQGAGLSARLLRGHLEGKLPEYMVPTALVPLEAMPLTPNGKVDRRALPAPEIREEEAPAAVTPRTPLEALIAGIWTEVLQTEVADVDANFFDIGGNSLLATQVIAMVQDILPIELPLRKVFEGPTVAGLARIIESGRGSLGEQEQRLLAEILVDFEQGMNAPTV